MLIEIMWILIMLKFWILLILPQLKDSESTIKNKLIDLLFELSGFKFEAILVLEFKKTENYDETKYSTFSSITKAETTINESDNDDIFESICTTIISNIETFLGKGSGRIIDSFIDHIINISKYNPLSGSTYIKLPK